MSASGATESQEQPSSSTSSILKERRFKLSRACDRCRRRRIKCDEGHPCQACLTANSACTFEEPGKRTHPHKSKRTATLEDRMHHLETLIQAIPPAVFAAGGMIPPNSGGHNPTDTISSPVSQFIYPTQFPQGVPPPSLHVFPLTNPSTHFSPDPNPSHNDKNSPGGAFGPLLDSHNSATTPEQLAEDTSRMSLAASYLYFDDEGCARWQGETSGLPVLDLLLERHAHSKHRRDSESCVLSDGSDPTRSKLASVMNTDWFPNRTPRRTEVNPQSLWRLMTSYIVPELMDSLVQCYLSTSYYILPFLHVPTFLGDYGNPQKWGEPGFASFIVAICCLASRHIDDPRVRANPQDGISAGTQWFELFARLQTLPIAEKPSLYNIQANLIAAVYAVGLGKLSRAAALLAEAVTMCIDAGMHRSADTYDVFDPIEEEVRKRTFWCVYIWDKQLGAHFGRPPMIRLRDCDVSEPAPVDDEFITRDGIGMPPPGTECRMSAFICAVRIMVVLESVIDVPPARSLSDSSSFLSKATVVLSGSRRFREMREEEALLDEVHRTIPAFWAHCPDTLASDDTIRFTQAERLHCVEHFVRLLIHRHRFSELMAERTSDNPEKEPSELEKEALIAAHNSALQIIATHLHIAKKGLMTYYGVHVIHQLTQAGRTLVAILLSCKTEVLQHLIPPGLDALRSCVGLLRRFSGRYVCGLRSGDLMEEFCRLTQIPLDTPRHEGPSNGSSRPPWIRPARKKAPSAPRSTHSGDSPSQHSSPESFSDFFVETTQNGAGFPAPPPQPAPVGATGPMNGSAGSNQMSPNSAQMFRNGERAAPGPTTSYMDPSLGLDMINHEPQMFMPSADMMSFFDEAGGNIVDVGNLFAASPSSSSASAGFGHPQRVTTNGLRDGYSDSPYLKLHGLATSP